MAPAGKVPHVCGNDSKYRTTVSRTGRQNQTAMSESPSRPVGDRSSNSPPRKPKACLGAAVRPRERLCKLYQGRPRSPVIEQSPRHGRSSHGFSHSAFLSSLCLPQGSSESEQYKNAVTLHDRTFARAGGKLSPIQRGADQMYHTRRGIEKGERANMQSATTEGGGESNNRRRKQGERDGEGRHIRYPSHARRRSRARDNNPERLPRHDRRRGKLSSPRGQDPSVRPGRYFGDESPCNRLLGSARDDGQRKTRRVT